MLGASSSYILVEEAEVRISPSLTDQRDSALESLIADQSSFIALLVDEIGSPDWCSRSWRMVTIPRREPLVSGR